MKNLSVMIVPLLLITPAIEHSQSNLAENEGREIELRINPPSGLTFGTQAESTVRISRGSVEPEVNKGIITTNGYYYKIRKRFYFQVRTATDQNHQQWPREMYNPLARVIQSSIVTIEVDAQGEILSLKGYEDLAERLKKEFKEQEIKDLMAKVDLNSLEDQAG